LVRYSNPNLAGTKNNAGLPNIVGTLVDSPTASASGSFARSGLGTYRAKAEASGSSYFGTTTFNASLSSPIYGSSDTVMIDSYNKPEAIYLG